MATKYGIISKGRLVKEISAEDLKKECRPTLLLDTSDNQRLLPLLSAFYAAEDIHPTNTGVRLVGEVRLNDLLKKLIEENIEIKSVTSSVSSIEDYYLSLIGGTRRV